MTERKLPAEQAAVLRTLAGEAEGVARFAEAVVAHLSAPPAATGPPEEVMSRVAIVLEGVADDGDAERSIEVLVGNPELLASIFQNADLLEPDAPETQRIARLVLDTLDRLGGGDGGW